MRIDAPFTAASRVTIAGTVYQVTVASRGAEHAPGELFLGLWPVGGGEGAAFQHLNRAWCDATGQWWGEGTGAAGTPGPVPLTVTGLAAHTAAAEPHTEAPEAHTPAAPAPPVAVAAHSGGMDAALRAPTKRRRAAVDRGMGDLFAPLTGEAA